MSSHQERHGGILPFIPAIVGAIASNKAHKKRVIADAANKKAYLAKYKGTAQESFSYDEQLEYEDMAKQADSQVRQIRMQEEALKSAWARVGANPDGSPLPPPPEPVAEKQPRPPTNPKRQ